MSRLRSFGRARPYIAPAVRRRKARNRLAALSLGNSGMVAFILAYALTAYPAPPMGVPNVAGFGAFVLVLGGFIALALGILAAMEA
jgi:uncharacterized membrane protein YdjX (TVP38/TMEM64 family)